MNIYIQIVTLLIIVIGVQSAVTVNTITGISSSNLVFSGTIPVSGSDNLFFTYYGIDG